MLLLTTAAAPAPAQSEPVRPDTLDRAQIQAAIQKGVRALYQMEPIYTFPPEHAFINKYYDQEVRNAPGNHALACWALLAAGESYQNPPLYRRINWVLSSDTPYTYDRGMRATMLHQLPHQRWFPWVRRDGMWLSGALTQGGNFSEQWVGQQEAGLGDNANGQYGVLGLWQVQSAGYSIEADVWRRIDQYWRAAQQQTEGDAPAGWGVFSFAEPPPQTGSTFYGRVSGPMTAGGVATLSLTERYLYGGQRLDGGRFVSSPELRKGIRWLDENFSITDEDEAADQYYYFWTVQRVGGATGYRTFNGVDWFRDITAFILNQQTDQGHWEGDKGKMLSTGFALLYLAKANDPLAISKVRFSTRGGDDHWNNRPHDVWNFTDYASDDYEVGTTWQIVELTQPIYGLIESPMLFMSTDDTLALSEAEIDNLRAYIEAGGLLVTNQETPTGEAMRGFKDLVGKLFPGQDFEPVPKEHPFYSVHQRLPLGVNMQVVSNGIRPLMVHFTKDIGRGLQANDPRSEGFVALSNLYLYVTGMNPRRSRLENHYVTQRNENPATALSAARLRHAGNFDPEPNALRQLAALLANRHGVDLQAPTIAPEELSQQKLAFLTAVGDAKLTDAEAQAIRGWIEAGGTLWIDAAGGGEAAHRNTLELLAQIAPGHAPSPLGSDSPIISGEGLDKGYDNRRVQFRPYVLRTTGPMHVPRLQAVMLGDRPAIIYSAEDLTCGLAGLDHWGIYGYQPESARQLALNGALLALKADAAGGITFAENARQQPARTPAVEENPAPGEPTATQEAAPAEPPPPDAGDAAAVVGQ